MGKGELLVRVRAIPERGQANEELCQLLACYFNRPRQAVAIISGLASSWKRVAIEGVESVSMPASGGEK